MNDKIAFTCSVIVGLSKDFSEVQQALQFGLNGLIASKKKIRADAQKKLEQDATSARASIEAKILQVKDDKYKKDTINNIRHEYGDGPIKTFEITQKQSAIAKYDVYRFITDITSSAGPDARGKTYIDGIEGYAGGRSIPDE